MVERIGGLKMARTIKFRAWDEEEEVMINGDSLAFEEYAPICDLLTQDWIMQYTGIKDKNGVEIYEGDIVAQDCYMWFDNGKPNYRGTVEWIYSQWQVVAHCVNQHKQGISDGVNEGLNDDGVDEGDKSNWIVIGNIYEHPNLLSMEDKA